MLLYCDGRWLFSILASQLALPGGFRNCARRLLKPREISRASEPGKSSEAGADDGPFRNRAALALSAGSHAGTAMAATELL
jgi:hypothetical protein